MKAQIDWACKDNEVGPLGLRVSGGNRLVNTKFSLTQMCRCLP